MTMPNDLRDCAIAQAAAFGLPSDLVLSVVMVESTGRWHAKRVERGWRYWFRRITLSKAEMAFQRTSWGPMQVMGAVARELGYKGPPDGEQLCSPLGVEYGCQKLAQLRKRDHSAWGWDGVARAYNTGRPRPSAKGNEYLRKIKQSMRNLDR